MKMYKVNVNGTVYEVAIEVMDGAPAARFMSELCKNLENFMTLLAQ